MKDQFNSQKQNFYYPVLLFLILMSALSVNATDVTTALSLKQNADSALYHQNYAEALRLYTASATRAQENSETDIYLRSMASIGQVYSMLDNYDRALVYFKRVLPDAGKVTERDFESRLLVGIITCLSNLGESEDANLYLSRLKTKTWSDSDLGKYYHLYLSGMLCRQEPDKASKWFKKALSHVRDSDLPVIYETSVLLQLGQIYDTVNLSDTSIQYYERAAESANRANTKDYLLKACSNLNQAYAKAGDPTMASQYGEKMDSLSETIIDQKQLENAQNLLYHAEETTHNNRISNLNETIGRQWALIVAFLILILILITLIAIIRKQKKRQDIAYRMIIDKDIKLSQRDDEIYIEKTKHRELLAESSEIDSQKSVYRQSCEMQNRINAVIENPEFIFSPDFSLSVLCQKVGSNRTYVSTAINDFYGKSFPMLLNERRVREGCRLLTESKLTVSEISHNLGYSTPTRFISAFKNIMGMTPAVYRRLKS